MSLITTLPQLKIAQQKENAPHKAGHYLILVARGGIEPPTQGFSILCSTD